MALFQIYVFRPRTQNRKECISDWCFISSLSFKINSSNNTLCHRGISTLVYWSFYLSVLFEELWVTFLVLFSSIVGKVLSRSLNNWRLCLYIIHLKKKKKNMMFNTPPDESKEKIKTHSELSVSIWILSSRCELCDSLSNDFKSNI